MVTWGSGDVVPRDLAGTPSLPMGRVVGGRQDGGKVDLDTRHSDGSDEPNCLGRNCRRSGAPELEVSEECDLSAAPNKTR